MDGIDRVHHVRDLRTSPHKNTFDDLNVPLPDVISFGVGSLPFAYSDIPLPTQTNDLSCIFHFLFKPTHNRNIDYAIHKLFPEQWEASHLQHYSGHHPRKRDRFADATVHLRGGFKDGEDIIDRSHAGWDQYENLLGGLHCLRNFSEIYLSFWSPAIDASAKPRAWDYSRMLQLPTLYPITRCTPMPITSPARTITTRSLR